MTSGAPRCCPTTVSGLLQAASTVFICATHLIAAVSAGAMALSVVSVLVFRPDHPSRPPADGTVVGRDVTWLTERRPGRARPILDPARG